MNVSAQEFNTATERYYRTGLKQKHLTEAISIFIEDCKRLERLEDPHFKQVMASTGLDISGADFISRNRESIIRETAEPETLLQMLRIGLAIINHERNPI
jgi:hypothetical protein